MKKILFIVLMSAVAVPTLFAQGFPVKPIRFIVPYPPGGGTDFLSRTLAARVGEALGQQIVIENRPGAQGNIGTGNLAKSPPDGYTIGLSYIGTFAINPWIYKDVGYDALKDFAHVTLASVQPYVIVVNPGVPVKNLKELAALAKSRPDRLTFASSAAAGQLAGELFMLMTKTKMVHIPYKGAGPAVIDVIGGQVDLMFSSPASAIPQVKGGRLRAIAVTGATRLGALQNVPTSKESGFPDFEISGWYGVAAPANTPRDVVARLNSAYASAIKMKEVRDVLQTDGLEATSNSPEEMTAFSRSEFNRWGAVVKASGVRAE